MTLRAETVARAALPPGERRRMLALMRADYEGVDAGVFARDLDAKDRVVLVRDGGTLVGFSTQRLFRHRCGATDTRVVFSGDTVIARAHRRSWALPVAWCRMMRDERAREPAVPLYWLLTSKGYRTYRYLPVFFRRFVPGPDTRPAPFERRLLGELGARLFGARYDAARGIAHAGPGAQRLRPGVAPVTPGRRANRHIAFFEAANPGHAAGDDLVCLAEWSEQNLRPFLLARL